MRVNWALVPEYEPKATIQALGDALIKIERVLLRGAATHPRDDWRDYPAAYHIGRARRHLLLLQSGDTSEPHLAARERQVTHGARIERLRTPNESEIVIACSTLRYSRVGNWRGMTISRRDRSFPQGWGHRER
jgi:hypothetical protein